MASSHSPSPAPPLIVADRLTFRYAGKTVVSEASFSIPKGSTTGFLGANGAGKSSTMRMLAGFHVPASGNASIAGFDVALQRRQAQGMVGYLPEAASGFGHLTTTEFLRFCSESREISGNRAKRAIDRCCTELDLAYVMSTPLRHLSKGWRQRVWLAQALLHEPPALILDEPTDGLDPIQKRHIRQLITGLSTSRAIILSTHILEEAEQLCDRAIIINHGTIIADRPVADLVDDRGSLAPAFFRLVG